MQISMQLFDGFGDVPEEVSTQSPAPVACPGNGVSRIPGD
jgi:hypothetical protein